MARPAQPLDGARRSLLLRTARLAFAANGFHAARLTAILRDADFPRSSFYYFFSTKERLLDEAVADGLDELARYVRVPRVAALDEATFWPALNAMVADLSQAARRPDLVAVGTLYHLEGLPACASMEAFRSAVTSWNEAVIHRGLELGLLDPTIPAQMHADLAYAVVSCIDRWATAGAVDPPDAGRIAATVVPRMLGAPQRPHGPVGNDRRGQGGA